MVDIVDVTEEEQESEVEEQQVKEQEKKHEKEEEEVFDVLKHHPASVEGFVVHFYMMPEWKSGFVVGVWVTGCSRGCPSLPPCVLLDTTSETSSLDDTSCCRARLRRWFCLGRLGNLLGPPLPRLGALAGAVALATVPRAHGQAGRVKGG